MPRRKVENAFPRNMNNLEQVIFGSVMKGTSGVLLGTQFNRGAGVENVLTKQKTKKRDKRLL